MARRRAAFHGFGAFFFPPGCLPLTPHRNRRKQKVSLEFMNFKLFGKTILVANIKFGHFWVVHSASENVDGYKIQVAPPKKSWNDDSSEIPTSNFVATIVSKWVHPQ